MDKLIEYDAQNQIFHLHNHDVSYLLSVEEGNVLAHLYFGAAVRHYHGQLRYPRADRGFSGNLPGSLDRTYSLDTLPREISCAGELDYHEPAVIVRQANGSNSLALRYQDYQIIDGKPQLPGLPAAFVEDDTEAQTLIIKMQDQLTGVAAELWYTVYRDQPIITRTCRLINQGTAKVNLEKLASMQLDFAGHANLESITLPGAYADERQMERRPLQHGVTEFRSRRGTSSHQMNPFIALVEPTTNEQRGDTYGMMLVYSGNHQISVEKDQNDQVRLLMGINDANFNWQLLPGQSFQAPEVVMTYSDEGLNGMSQNLHHLIQERIIRSKFKHQERPIVVNNWEATYFDFDESKLQPIVDEAQAMGIEMFVLDDGWFGHRDDDNSSLGDWQVYQKKFPHGLAHFADYVHAKGLKFGIWFEPEMISFDSQLYRAHPDWLMRVPDRQPSPSRNQYVLDLTRKDVRDNLVTQISAILQNNQIDYVKWDMNRSLSDIYSLELPADRQGEVYHRYVLGLYDLMERITQAFPDILFEGCSGGGGRFDAGIAYYMPQIWPSDNTDAIARLKIQYGTSLVYPISMTTAHVSVIPNQQTGRQTPFATRGAVAMSGVFGYELDLTKLTDDEKQQVKCQVAKYKAIRPLVQYGHFYRLKSPFEGNQAAWMFIDDKRSEAIVMTFNVLTNAANRLIRTVLVGLDPQKDYEELMTHQVYGGDELMKLGFYDPLVHQDFTAKPYHFKVRQ